MASRSRSNINKNEKDSLENGRVYIRKVILENFLSFQKDEVDFGKAKFVIIVGPNWSGKTSIFQAIKFVLGSNARDDRYKKWSDFIRNDQNHAMVEIHIQNGEEIIKIRRHVIRGQSPYYNIKRIGDKDFKKSQVHEIQRLIADLNINPDNQFAFVSQGKIDAIKNLKPSELCSFLEEGIGLKDLREEILQQKNSVATLNNDLQSLKTRKNTMNISLNLLNPKLERLKRKNELLKIKKKFTDELLWANRDKLDKEIRNIEEILKHLKNNAARIKKKKEFFDANILVLIDKISKKNRNINKLSEKIGELNYKKKDLITKIQGWQNDKIVAKQELDVLSAKVEEIEKTINNYRKQQETLDNELKGIKQESKKVEIRIDKLIKEQHQLIKKIKQNSLILEEYNKLISEKKRKQTLIQENEKIIQDMNSEINQLFQSFKDIDHKLEKNKWFLENPTKNLLKGLDRNLSELSLKLYDMDLEKKKLEIEKSKKLHKLKILQASLRERRVILPSNITILKEEINKRGLKVKGPLIDYLKYDDKLSYAIESVLGEKLLYSFVANDWDTLNLLKRLKEKYRAYCNIYLPKKLNIRPMIKISANGVLGYLAELIKIIDEDIAIKKVIYSKVKNCLVVKDYRSGREIYDSTDFKGKCVTLKGEQIVSYRYVFETPYLKRLKGLLSAGTQKEQSKVLEFDINSLNERILELKVEQSNLDNVQKDYFKKKESFSDLLYNFNQRQRITAKKNQLYDEMHDIENNNTLIKTEVKAIEQQIKNLKTQTDPEFFKWNDRIIEIPKELVSFNERKKKWDLKSSESTDFLKEVSEKINTYTLEQNTLKQEHDTKKKAFQKADSTAFDIYRQLENVEDEHEVLKKQVLTLNETIIKFQGEKQEIERENIQITLNLEQENIKINSYNQDLTQKKIDLGRINTEIGPLITKHEFPLRPIQVIQTDIFELDKKLLQYLDVDDSLLIERDQILASLKKITTNQNDLEKDIKAAGITEKKMEATYYQKFSAVLKNLQINVNQKFKDSQVKSYCSLDLTGNFKELGVNIKAATSKEQLKSFTALSGGQVSLISICLILSLQEIKPSPLCMFDEAGMFLDEKNSEVAYELIKSTLEKNPIQLFMFLPKSSNSLFLLAEKLIGVARVGKNEISSIFKPKIIRKNNI